MLREAANTNFNSLYYPLENAQLDYAAYMKKASSEKTETKKVVKLTKKKKTAPEGGC